MVIPERPTIQALAIFAEVARHGTMTAAAEAAGISQPAISAQVKALERYYGTRLLERDGRGSTPTAAGRLVADYAVRVLALVDELGRGVADLEGLTAGELIVGASSTVGEQLLPTYLGQFHAAHPQVRLSVRIGNSADISALVAARELDFAIVGEEPSDRDLFAEPVLEDQIVAFVAPNDPLLREAPITPVALCGRQFVMREAGSATRALGERCLRETSCGPGHVIELGSNEAVKRAVEAGLGIGVLSTYTIEAERLAGLLVDLPIMGWGCSRSFWLIRRRDRVLTRAEEAFLALVPRP
jgi:LysR family transcriptional regulator, low CO2-responsive transcriptional regulator